MSYNRVYRRKPLKPKYIFRRVAVSLVLVVLLGGSGWFFVGRLLNKEPDKSVDASESVPDDIESQISEPEPAVIPNSKAEDVPQSDSPSSEADNEPEASEIPESVTTSAPVGDWSLMLVNQQSLLPDNYVPELEAVNGGYKVDKRIADSVNRMFEAAARDNIELMICSAYRSVDYQKTLFANKKQEFLNQGKNEQDAVAAASTIVAIPNTSEHHTGLAMDIVTPSYQSLDSGFENTNAFKWLDQNAHKYGFILRFPEDKQNITRIIYEPWHYRYVGEEDAGKIKAQGLCLEEYLGQAG